MDYVQELRKHASNGDIRNLEALLVANHSLSQNDLDVALNSAVRANQIKSAEFLIKRGSDLNAIAEDGLSQVCAAVISSAPDVLELLLGAGADPNVRDEFGVTPLVAAIRVSFDDEGEAMARMLLRSGARVDLLAAVAAGDEKMIVEMLTAPSSLDQYPDHSIILADALNSCNDRGIEIIQMLFEHGLQVDAHMIRDQASLYKGHIRRMLNDMADKYGK